MTTYALIDSVPSLVRLQDFDGTPPTLTAEKGLRWVEFVEITATPTETQASNGYDDALESGKWVRRWSVRDKTYVERRLTVPPCYAPLSEQLDMQYRSMDEWHAHIAAVKAAHPKPVV